MSDTRIPTMRLRWLRRWTRDRSVNEGIPWPETVLQQAFRKPGSDVDEWEDVPLVSDMR